MVAPRTRLSGFTDIVVTVGLVPGVGNDTLGGLTAVIWGGVFFSVTLFVIGIRCARTLRARPRVGPQRRTTASLRRTQIVSAA